MSRECSRCGWTTWHDPLSPQATVLPYVCAACETNPMVGARCSACNHHFRAAHLEHVAMGHHRRCASCKDIPQMQFAERVHCWCCQWGSGLPSTPPCCGDATQLKKYPKHCDCAACWQTWYHVCDRHAADWLHDKSDQEQRAIMRRRGARIIELADGAWTFEWPEPTN